MEGIKRIEHLIERCKQCKLNACITCDICWSEVQAIENLLERYKELKKEECCMTTCLRKDKKRVFFENRVIERIEELEPKIKEFSKYIEDSTGTEKIYWKRQRAELVGARNVLQELLGG